MLTQAQIEFTWEKLIAAETRVLYFGDLAAHYNRIKQAITGVSFFLSSGAAATLIGGSPKWVPEVLATIVAVATAYSIAVGIDRKITTAIKLHCGWHAIAADCNRLWNHTYEEDAEQLFDDIVNRERDLSEIATVGAPNDQRRMDKWQQQVFRQYHLINP
jgi:hypothetical protein